MRKLVIALFALSLGLFSIPSFAIADDYYTLPSWEDYPDKRSEQNRKALEELSKSEYTHKVTRETPTVFNLTIEGKTHECYYEGINIICE